MAGLLETLEQEIADALLADPFFADIPVHVDPQKNIVDEVTRKISQLTQLVAPLVASAGCKNPDDPGPVFAPITIQVGVFERPVAKLASGWNGKTARQICEKIHGVLHLWKPGSLSAVIYSGKNAISQVADKTLNIFNCEFETEGALVYQLPQLAAVVWATGPGTLTCATAGAAIFYTTDGTWPGPRNGTLYTGAIHPSGVTLKARAFLAGYLASALMTAST